MAFRVGWWKALHPRLFAGLALSFVPEGLRRRLNRWGNSIMQHRHNSVYVDDFGGSIGKT